MSDAKTFAPPIEEDGASTYEASMGGSYAASIINAYSADIYASSETDLINRYRHIAMQPEADAAIDDIVNEAVVYDGLSKAVSINLDHVDGISESIKTKIAEEFDNIQSLLEFNTKGYDIFKRWYIDGKLVYHMVVDEKKASDGIKEMRPIDPRCIKKIREIVKTTDKDTNQETIKEIKEYYVYTEILNRTKQRTQVLANQTNQKAVIINPNVISYVPSGLIDNLSGYNISYLHKAIKPFNQMAMIEDALVIYRLSRAPERRVFYVDVGNLPKTKAEEYVRSLMNMYKNRIVYNANTGEIADDRRHMHMLEDFWMPRRDGSKGTEIQTLPGGQSLSEIDDVLYFQKKFYKALGVPTSRLESDKTFNMGRSSEITRDEIKFQKHVCRLRIKFNKLFDDSLRLQLILKNIIKADEWDSIKQNIIYNYNKDAFFAELKDLEIMAEKMKSLTEIQPFVGTYYSMKEVRKAVLFQSDEKIKQIEADIEQEKKEGKHKIIDPSFDQYRDPANGIVNPNEFKEPPSFEASPEQDRKKVDAELKAKEKEKEKSKTK